MNLIVELLYVAGAFCAFIATLCLARRNQWEFLHYLFVRDYKDIDREVPDFVNTAEKLGWFVVWLFSTLAMTCFILAKFLEV